MSETMRRNYGGGLISKSERFEFDFYATPPLEVINILNHENVIYNSGGEV